MSVRTACLSNAAPAGQFLAAVSTDAVRQITTHKSKVTQAAPDELHQVRIGLRKLDAAIRLFSSIIPERSYKRISKELKWLRGELSAARNLDVFCVGILKPLMRQSEPTPAVPVFHEACRRELDKTYARATRYLRSAKFRRLIDDIRKLIKILESSRSGIGQAAQPAADIAASALKTIIKKMKMGRAVRALSRRDLHRLRLRTKRMRYSIQFTSGLFGEKAGKKAQKMAKALSHIQAHLGEITDMESHVKIINHLMKTTPQHPMSDVSDRAGRARLLTRLIGHRVRKRERLLKKAAAAYGAFAAASPFWSG